jgi:hypothetical protein
VYNIMRATLHTEKTVISSQAMFFMLFSRKDTISMDLAKEVLESIPSRPVSGTDLIPNLAKEVLESIPSRPVSRTGHKRFSHEGTAWHHDDSRFPDQATPFPSRSQIPQDKIRQGAFEECHHLFWDSLTLVRRDFELQILVGKPHRPAWRGVDESIRPLLITNGRYVYVVQG